MPPFRWDSGYPRLSVPEAGVSKILDLSKIHPFYFIHTAAAFIERIVLRAVLYAYNWNILLRHDSAPWTSTLVLLYP